MLVLTRGLEQSVVISGGITVKVLRIGENKVKLGFDAPLGVVILREELTHEAPGDAAR